MTRTRVETDPKLRIASHILSIVYSALLPWIAEVSKSARDYPISNQDIGFEREKDIK